MSRLNNFYGFNSAIFINKKYGYILLSLNLIFLYTRPQEILTFIQPFRIPGILSLAMLIWFLINFKTYPFRERAIVCLVLIIASYLVSSIGAVNVVGYRRVITWATVYFPLVFSIYLLVCSPERYKNFISLWCFIHLAFALIVFKNGGVGPGDFIYDENDAALGLGMAAPIAYYYSKWKGSSVLWKFIIYSTFILLTIGIILTQSRGGLLGLFSIFGMIWIFSSRKMLILTATAILVMVSWGLIHNILPEGYINDVISGVTDPSDSTRVERFRSWEIAWLMFLDNFIFGVGAGNFPYNVGRYQLETSWWQSWMKSLEGRQVHSLYFEILADLGLIGFVVIFGTIIYLTKKCLSIQSILNTKKRNLSSDNDQINIALIARALVVSIVCYLISGAFISVSYYPHLPIWITMVAITLRYAREVGLHD